MVAGRRILASLTPVVPPELVQLVEDLDIELVVPSTRDATGVRYALLDADIVVSDWSGALALTPEEAATADLVAVVLSPGVGVESIDLAAWAQRHVPVANTAGANARSVSEWCVGATLAVLRSMVWADGEMRAGAWPQVELAARGCRDLGDRHVGLVGFGAIGQACATRFAAFGCTVSYWSRRRRPPDEECGATYKDLDHLLADSEVVVVAIALTPETRGLLGSVRLGRMRPDAVLVNASRGAVVDESALLDVVAHGRLSGAALDVYSVEPLPMDSPLRSCERILLSPHAASATVEGRGAIFSAIATNLRRALAGEPLRCVVNGVDPVVRWRR
jgi:D-3-phosphoglycerate dehydrogenase / 2-oxoglutarate reductase